MPDTCENFNIFKNNGTCRFRQMILLTKQKMPPGMLHQVASRVWEKYLLLPQKCDIAFKNLFLSIAVAE